MNRFAACLAAIVVAAALGPPRSSAGFKAGDPAPPGDRTGPAAGKDDINEEFQRFERIRDLISGDAPVEGDVMQYAVQIRTEIDAISDSDLRDQLLVALRLKYPAPVANNAGPGQGPKPGDPNFTPSLVWEFRKGYVPDWTASSPNSPVAWAEKGHMGCAVQNYRQCFVDLDRAIQLGAKDPETIVAYGNAAHNLGDYAKALQAANMVLKQDPNNKPAFGLQKLSENRVNTQTLPSSAFEGMGEAGLGPMPGAFDPGVEAGAGALAVGQLPPQGAPQPGVARPGAPGPFVQPPDESAVQRSSVYTKEAAAALVVRDYVLAHESASHAIQLNNRNAQAWNYRAIANNKLDRFNDAVYDASYALNLVPGNTPALQSRAWALSKTGKYKEALGDANFTLEREPNNAFAFQNRAFALAGMGDRAGMLESLKRSAELDARFKERYEAALQAPESGDILFLFDEESASAKTAPVSPQTRKKRFVRMVALVVSGGFLVALGLLHVLSATWREKVRNTVRYLTGGTAEASPGAGPAPADGAAPTTGFWSQYQLVREVGLGGMGVVYEGRDQALDRPVAIKRMRDEIRLDRREKERFLQEARMVAALHHPNIVEIFSIVEDGVDLYLVFEFASGKTLAALLEERGTLPLEQARHILKHSCAAVEYAHRHKIIHRDIKPSNIMVTDDGSCKVMDFGVARQAKDAMTKTMTNTVVGTPPYMAPELEQGTVRPESDVYALGIVFYEMLTGELPFAGQGAGMLLNKLNGRFAPLSSTGKDGFPPGLDGVMAKVLSPDPDKRYRNAPEFLAAVEGLGC
ncbi:MAG: protein kinase [Elusimicrobia bacterium]|nr:protein kinase [Elusimicrobiota bacterium]